VGPPATGSSRRRSGGGLQNAEIAFLGDWYKLETPWPLDRPSQTHLGASARAPADCRTWGFWEGGGKQRLRTGSWPLRAPSAAPALGWAPWVGVRPPMHTDLPRKQNWPFRAPRANFPCRIALYPGGHRSGPHRGVRRNLRMCFRLIRAVSTRRAGQSCIDLAFCAQQCWRLRGWPCALEDERCSDQIESRGTRCDPRRLDRLVYRTQCE
jgi:hypothetical protein